MIANTKPTLYNVKKSISYAISLNVANQQWCGYGGGVGGVTLGMDRFFSCIGNVSFQRYFQFVFKAHLRASKCALDSECLGIG